MSRVIREVVVKLGIEQSQTALKPPDVTEAQNAIDAFVATSKKALSELEVKVAPPSSSTDAVDKVVDTVVDTAQEAIDKHPIVLPPVDTTKVVDAVEDYGDTSRDVLDKVWSDWGKTGQAIDQVENATKQVTTTHQASAAAIVDANTKTLDSFKAAGEGAFTLARGIAFVGASSEQDFQKALKTIAKFQGAFDIFKGATDTIRGVAEGMKVLTSTTSVAAAATGVQSAATTAQAGAAGKAATANGVLAASNTAVATTSGAAATGMAALQVALGPVGIAIAAISAVVAGLVWAFTRSEKEADKAKEAWGKAADDLDRYRQHKETLSRFSFEDDINGLRDMGGQLEAVQKRGVEVADALEQNGEAIRRTQEAADRARGNAEVEAALRAQELSLLQERDQLLEAAAKNEKERLSLQKQQSVETEKELQQQLQSLEAIKGKLDAENARLQSMDAQFGAMTALEQKELERLSKKVEGGEQLSRQELINLQRLGGSSVSGFVDQQFAAMGNQAGSRDVFARFGVDTGGNRDNLRQQQAGILQALGLNEDQAGMASQVVADRIREMADERKRVADKTVNLLEMISQTEMAVEQRIDKLEQEFRRRRK